MPKKSAVIEVDAPEVSGTGIETTSSGLEIKASQKVLSELINLAGKAVPSRASHPVLMNLLLVAESDRLQVTGFDLTLGIEATGDVQVINPGRLTVPKTLLADIIARLDGEVHLREIQTDVGSIQLEIRSGKSEFVIQGLSADEFPALPDIDGTTVFEVPKLHLEKGLSDCAYAVSGDETKQVLTCIHLSVISTEPGSHLIENAATDGHRMVRSRVGDGTGDVTGDTPSFNLLGKSAREWVAAINSSPKDLETATVAVGDSCAALTVGNYKLWTRLIEGQYPHYNQLIPKQFTRTITCKTKEIKAALERAMVVADQKNNVVVLTVDKPAQTLTITVDAQDVGRVREEIPVDADMLDDKFQAAFNGKYLMDVLKSSGPSLQLMANSPTSPVVVRPGGEEAVLHLLMPVQIRQ